MIEGNESPDGNQTITKVRLIVIYHNTSKDYCNACSVGKYRKECISE